MALRAAAPDVWERFVDALVDYSDDIALAMVSAPPDTLPRAQGMALQAREIAQTLVNAPKLYDKAQAARLGKRHV